MKHLVVNNNVLATHLLLLHVCLRGASRLPHSTSFANGEEIPSTGAVLKYLLRRNKASTEQSLGDR